MRQPRRHRKLLASAMWARLIHLDELHLDDLNDRNTLMSVLRP
jgi:hypothetical protein